MRFDIITLFPDPIKAYFGQSILKRAQEKRLIKIRLWQLRDFVKGKYKKVDDKPFGGGAGMVLMAEPILRAIDRIKKEVGRNLKTKMIILSAKGRQFNQKTAFDLSKKYNHLILVAGRYEGIDERVKVALKAKEISIGPYVLTDGDAPAMVVVSAVSRLIPGVIRFESLEEESFFNSILKKETGDSKNLEYPHYTRPEVIKYKGGTYKVPKVLLSGNHKKIQAWRRLKSL